MKRKVVCRWEMQSGLTRVTLNKTPGGREGDSLLGGLNTAVGYLPTETEVDESRSDNQEEGSHNDGDAPYGQVDEVDTLGHGCNRVGR